ncbi:MAG: F0F1 ATP synthase subunit epsilon [Ruminococcaceae bacterium]|nr:F0F1 ATP synthase subunit epsilon [Oscillospiraceae bacterium]
MNTFRLTVSSPDGNIFDGEVVKLDVRGVEGDLAVMAGHIPFVTYLVKAPCTIFLPDGTKRIANSDGGLLTVGKNAATLLSGTFKFQ